MKMYVVLGFFQDVWLNLQLEKQPSILPITRLQTSLYVKNASNSLLWSLHDVYIENLIRFLYLPKNKIYGVCARDVIKFSNPKLKSP